MRSLKLIASTLFLLSSFSFGQTAIITGTVRDLGNNLITNGKIVFTLKPSIDSTIAGGARFVPGPPVTCGINPSGQVVNFVAGAPGVASCIIVQNTALTPGGTYYQVDICPYYACLSRFAFFALASTYDISTIYPTPGTSPVFGAASGGSFAFTPVVFSATPTFTPAGSFQLWTMTLIGNVTAPILNPGTQPSMFVFELTQDGVGSRTFTWPANVIGGATIGSAANSTTVQAFVWDGTNARALGPAVVNP